MNFVEYIGKMDICGLLFKIFYDILLFRRGLLSNLTPKLDLGE